MQLVESYIKEVTRRVPAQKREKIATELQSTIDEMLPGNYSEQEEKAVLEKLGNPALMASKYVNRPMYLIGPRYFELYITVMKIVFPIVAITLFILTILGELFSFSGEEKVINFIFSIIMESVLNILGALFQAFFWITAIFVILERRDKSKSNVPLTVTGKEWTPEDLKALSEKAKEKLVSKWELFISLFGLAIFLFLYFYNEKIIGVYESYNGELEFVLPVFNAGVLLAFWPIIMLAITIEVGMLLYRYVIGQWTKKMALWNTVRNLFSTIVFLIVIFEDNLMNHEFVSYTEGLFDFTVKGNISYVTLIVSIWIIIAVIDVIKGFTKAYQR